MIYTINATGFLGVPQRRRGARSSAWWSRYKGTTLDPTMRTSWTNSSWCSRDLAKFSMARAVDLLSFLRFQTPSRSIRATAGGFGCNLGTSQFQNLCWYAELPKAWLVTTCGDQKQTEGRTDQCRYLTALLGELWLGRSISSWEGIDGGNDIIEPSKTSMQFVWQDISDLSWQETCPWSPAWPMSSQVQTPTPISFISMSGWMTLSRSYLFLKHGVMVGGSHHLRSLPKAEKHESPEKLALVEKALVEFRTETTFSPWLVRQQVKNVQKSGHMARQLPKVSDHIGSGGFWVPVWSNMGLTNG